MEQIVAGTAPDDYKKPNEFFKRTCFTRALRDHTAMALRRLLGKTGNTSPVMALVTQFGGGKTHTLATLYHLVRGEISIDELRSITRGSGEQPLLGETDWLDDFTNLPRARVAVFVGNAWDPQEGAETPWIDVARQLVGEKGVEALGKEAKSVPPGTNALARIFEAADAPVLVLFDEVLNFINRHRNFADSFYAFIQNLVVAMTGTTHGVAMISLPRSQVEMTEWDQQWQAKITKVVKRVAKDLIVNDEAEIAEVVRRRLFVAVDSAGVQKAARSAAKAYASWCFEKRAQLPPEWTAVDTATTDAKAKDFLRQRFEASYPFHPATLSVFQRKWQALPQYQQTRGTLAMFAQWVSWAFVEQHQRGLNEPLLTLGRAPLNDPDFRSTVLGQLGEPRLAAVMETDVAGPNSHARALDADTKGPLRDIHRRVGSAILFESSGGQTEKLAHLPELRFGLGGPDLDTTSIDNAAIALEKKGYFIRPAGSDGFRFGFRRTLKKVVADRRASLDEDEEVLKPMRAIVRQEFEKRKTLTVQFFPEDGDAVADTPRLIVAVLSPAVEWDDRNGLRETLAEWTHARGSSDRLYPATIVWCVRKPGRDLRKKVELWQAWRKVKREIDDGTLGGEYEHRDLSKVDGELTDAAEDVADEVWASYRFVVIADPAEPNGVKLIDLGVGHASSGQSLTQRILLALKSDGYLNESVGAGYLERNWPPALKESGAWPLSSMRQAFLNGALTRLIDPDAVLRAKIVEFVQRGDFGLGSSQRSDGTFERVCFREPVSIDEVTFDAQVFLLAKGKAEELRRPTEPEDTKPVEKPDGRKEEQPEKRRDETETGPEQERPKEETPKTVVLRVRGAVTPEVWNKLGVRLLPRLRSGTRLRLGLDFECELSSNDAKAIHAELRQAITDLRLDGHLHVLLD